MAKILIANRGAIACRIARTVRKLGMGSVAVYSEADADSLHVRAADEAVPLGASAPATSYLDAAKILNAAKEKGAGVIHPGYGFLSENAAFAEACEREGIAFSGPTPTQIRKFGLKNTARDVAREGGVPDEFPEQCALVWTNLGNVLASAWMSTRGRASRSAAGPWRCSKREWW